MSNANVLISCTLWDEKFLSLKKNYDSKIKLILVQQFIIKKSYFKILKKKKFDIDYCFIYDEMSEQILRKYYFTNFIKIGSFKNNHYAKNKIKINKSILLISGFKDGNLNNPKWKRAYLFEKKILKIIQKIFQKNSYFRVLLKPNIKIDDYQNFTNCKKNIIFSNNGNGYRVMDKFNLIITIHGSMGKEALARGLKHVEVPHIVVNKKLIFNVFSKKLNYANLRNFLIYYLQMPNKKYFQIYKKNNSSNIYYDEQNKLFKQIIKKTLLLQKN